MLQIIFKEIATEETLLCPAPTGMGDTGWASGPGPPAPGMNSLSLEPGAGGNPDLNPNTSRPSTPQARFRDPGGVRLPSQPAGTVEVSDPLAAVLL